MSDDINDRFFDPEDYRASAAMRGGKPQSELAPAPGSVASAYRVKKRESDGRWCIYLRRYNCVVAEFGDGNQYDAMVIKEILDDIK